MSAALDYYASRIIVDANGCHIWQGAPKPNGYGQVSQGRKYRALAHRWSYELHRGLVPSGLELDHLCRVRICVNPDHLEPVTRRVNMLRGESFASKNAVKTACMRGHPFDEANTYYSKSRWGRICRTCQVDAKRRRVLRLKEQAVNMCQCGHERARHQVWTASLMPEIAAHNPAVLPFYAGCLSCDCLAFKR